MKNFKLLLATTAILSTGALLANADSLDWSNYSNTGINIPLSVKVVDPIKVAVERGINFGIVENNDSDKTKTLVIDKDGKVSGTAQYFGGAHTGLVWYKITESNEEARMKLEFPKTPVQLFYGDGTGTLLCGEVDSFEQKEGTPIEADDMSYIGHPIYVGAKFISNGESNHIGSNATLCTGSVTATLVYDISE